MTRALLFFLAIGGAVLAGTSTAPAGSFFKVGEVAPDFTLTTVTGETISLKHLRGKVVVLGLFHICEPCLIQGTNLQTVHERTQGKPVAVIGVNSSGDSLADVQEFLQHFPVKVTYPYAIDPERMTDKLYGGGRFIPNVYIIDQQGIIRWQRVGNMDLADADVILQEVEKLLAEAKPPTSPHT
ncbi:MAG: TlpA family protein disulfide reductase [Nitrospirae bacterium]|nr:MAG: TlpA family protein disulfide reductase [Nitrospirota bacterium]